MTFNEYQGLAQRTAATKEFTDKLANGALGLCGESGEVADQVKKTLFQGHMLDRDHIIEELGDVMWYVAETASAMGVSMDDIAQGNIAKLMKRYPDGFDAERSIHR